MGGPGMQAGSRPGSQPRDGALFGPRHVTAHPGEEVAPQVMRVHGGLGIGPRFGQAGGPGRIVDQNLEAQRTEPDPAKRKEFAENVNRQMATQCYQFANSWTIWGTPRNPKVHGLGTLVFPDGSRARDGAGFSGQFYTHTIWIDA